MFISHDVSINLNIDIYKEHRKISKKIREIHRLLIKGRNLTIVELNKVNILPKLELYLQKMELNKYKAKTINSKLLDIKPITNKKCINMFNSVDDNQINQDIINFEKSIENVNAYIQEMNEKYPITHNTNNNINYAQHTTNYPSTIGIYASPIIFNKLTIDNKASIRDKYPLYSAICNTGIICGETMNPIYREHNIDNNLSYKKINSSDEKNSLTPKTDNSLSNTIGYREWLLYVYNNNWEKYYSIEELDWICSFLESLN